MFLMVVHLLRVACVDSFCSCDYVVLLLTFLSALS